jgi:prolyl oligopeptidase
MRCILAGIVLGTLAALTGAAGAAERAATPASAADQDPYLWLANIHSPDSLAWVARQTAHSSALLEHDPFYRTERRQILATLNAHDRIPEGTLRREWVLNFWQDSDHVRGIWRRTRISDYASHHPHWQTLLDLDRLDRESHHDWAWAGADCTPDFRRCLISLSPGGSDAVVIREYDPLRQSFIPGGFELPLAKSTASYVDQDSILFASDFGPGTLTPSSYPRIVKLWRRGEPVNSARIVFTGRSTDMQVSPQVFHGTGGTVALVLRQPSFFRTDFFLVRPNGTSVPLSLPEDAQLQGVTRGRLIATLQDPWTIRGRTIPRGSLIAVPVESASAGREPEHVDVLYSPGAHEMIDAVAAGEDAVFASVYRDVTGSIYQFRPGQARWRSARLNLPAGGSTSIVSVNDWGPQAYFSFESFLTPPTLFYFDGEQPPRAIKSQPARFDSHGLVVQQYWATAHDGTQIPYFFIGPTHPTQPLPTILYGYGGFQLSLTPWYWNDGHRPLDAGQAWLKRGGAIAVANIRGGGEFGPGWHEAALMYHRQRAFDDFESVAADIEHRGLSLPSRLGIVGASNGGLLVSTVMAQRPQLFAAVVCQRPLIDMLRYTHYGAGASWIAEYGDPAEPAMARYIRSYSPYENVRADVRYPPVLFITETSDDRVTPVFARMMAAKMQAQGHEVLFYESTEGGHGPGATHAEEADYWALSYAFLARHLGLPATPADTLAHSRTRTQSRLR